MEEGRGHRHRSTRKKEGGKSTKAHLGYVSRIISLKPHKRPHDVDIINPILQMRKQRP